MQIRIKRVEEKNISEFTLPTIAISKQCLGQGFFLFNCNCYSRFSTKNSRFSLLCYYTVFATTIFVLTCHWPHPSNRMNSSCFSSARFVLPYFLWFCATAPSLVQFGYTPTIDTMAQKPRERPPLPPNNIQHAGKFRESVQCTPRVDISWILIAK